MHCKGCDKNLSDYESVKKDKNGVYLDLCGRCVSHTKGDINPFNETYEEVADLDWGDEDEV